MRVGTHLPEISTNVCTGKTQTGIDFFALAKTGFQTAVHVLIKFPPLFLLFVSSCSLAKIKLQGGRQGLSTQASLYFAPSYTGQGSSLVIGVAYLVV